MRDVVSKQGAAVRSGRHGASRVPRRERGWLGLLLLVMAAMLWLPAVSAAADDTPVNQPTPQFRRYGTVEGLPSSSVYVIAQDLDGAMWFGTKGGIVRYDGSEFKVFRHVADDPDSLFDNGISALIVDRDNQIWAGGLEAGLNHYDPLGNRFTHWGHQPAQADSLASDKVWAVAQDQQGAIWVGTAAGLDRLRDDRRGFVHQSPPPGAHFGTVSALYVDNSGQLWVGTGEGAWRRDRQGRWHAIVPAAGRPALDVWRIEGDGDELRLATTSGLYRVDPDDRARPMASDGLVQANVFSSVRDRHGRLWIGTQRGLYLAPPGDRPARRLIDQPALYGNLPGSWVWNIYCDREGGLWVALFDGGIGYLAPGWDHFSRYTHIPDDPASLRDSVATTTALGRDGRIWVGQRAGRVDRLDPHDGSVEHVLDGLHGDVIGMTEDERHSLWVVVQGNIYRYRDGLLSQVDSAAQGVRRPLEVELGPDQQMYVRSFGDGVARLDRQTLRLTPVPFVPAEEGARWGSQMTLKHGVFWYASDGGLWRLAADGSHFQPVGEVGPQAVNAFDFTADGVWLARPDALEYYRFEGGRLERQRQIRAADGWPSINVLDLAADRLGRVWIFGRDGLWRFDPDSQRFRQLGLRDGLVNGEFSRGFARATNGYIYAPSLGGVVGFNPAQRDETASPPPLAITGISLRQSDGLRRLRPPFDDTLTIDWRNRGLDVQARAFSYVDPPSNHYRFRLLGFDPGWVDTGNRGERDFAGLLAGDYTLQILAASADGEWGSLALPLKIHVEAPPWVRWWAWLLYALALAALIGLALLIGRRRLAQRHAIGLAEQQRALAEQASAAKTQFLATLSHEIRTPMTGVLGMAELLLATQLDERQLGYAETIQRSGDLLLKLLNDALDLARIEAGRMSLERAPFSPRALVEEVAQLERPRAQAKGLQFHVELDDALPAWLDGDAFRIRQILFNLSSNALKFTERGSVTLRAQMQPGGVSFEVRDTGPGIAEAAQERLFQPFEQGSGAKRQAGSGLGLAICRQLVSLMGGRIELYSRVAHGSSFRVHLPLPAVAAPPAPASPGATAARAAGARRILLVEDDPIVARVITGLLHAQGHAVTSVGNGLGALAELSRRHFDLMLLDLDLPGVSGFQLARIIRKRPSEWPLPIIAVSARSAGDEEQRVREAGMDGFLRKPLSGDQLAALLAGLPDPPPME